VLYDDGQQGWVDTVFEGLDEYWICDAKTKELIFQALGAGDVRSFQKAELTFTGEWSRSVESEAVVQIPPEVVEKIVGTEDWESTWEEKTKVVLQIEHLVAGAPGRILIGPGFPPDVKAAERTLVEHVRDLVRNQEVLETIEVKSDLVARIQAEENWEAEWEEQADVKVRLEVYEDGLTGRISIGPGPQSVVTKAVALLSMHLHELGDGPDDEGQGAEPKEITAEDLQKQLDRLQAEQEEEAKLAAEKAAEAEAAAADEEMALDQGDAEEGAEGNSADGFEEGGMAEDVAASPSWRTVPGKPSGPRHVPPTRPTATTAKSVAFSKASLGPPPKAYAQPDHRGSEAAAAPVQSQAQPGQRRPEVTAAQGKAVPVGLKGRLVAVSSISRASALARAARAKLAALDAGEAEPELEASAAEKEEGLEGEEGEGGQQAGDAAAPEPATADGAEAGVPEAAPADDAQKGTQETVQAEGGEAATSAEGAEDPATASDAALQAPSADASQTTGEAGATGGEGQESQTIEYWLKNQAQFSHLPALPAGWIRIKSKSMGYIYYANLLDGTTTLQEPGQREQATTALPPGWTEVTSRSTGQVYYWHSATGHAQFVRPLG